MELESMFEFYDSGGIRIKGTRVSIDIVVDRYNEGWSAEDIEREYPSLDLTQVYATITYYLLNKKKIDAYIKEADEKIEAAWRKQRRNPHPGIKRVLEYKAKHGLLEKDGIVS